MTLAELELAVEQPHPPFLTELYTQNLGNRTDEGGNIPWEEELDPESN